MVGDVYSHIINNTIRINLRLAVAIGESPEYILIKIHDNPYLKENKLYRCEPDGTPIACTEENTQNISGDGIDFYAELKDGVTLPEDFYFEIAEIRRVPVTE